VQVAPPRQGEPEQRFDSVTSLPLSAPRPPPVQVPQPPASPPRAGLVEEAKLLEFHAAEYPPGQLFRAVEAEIPVLLQVGTDGWVTSVTANPPGSFPDWIPYVRPALLKTKFEPARVGGKPASAVVSFVYRFAIAKPPVETQFDFVGVGDVTGEVLAGGQRVPVPGVDVVAQGLGIGATTDAKGRFAMKLPPGDHVLVVAAPGFLPLQQALELPAGNDAEVTLYPRRTEVGELSATVQGERTRTSPTKQTMVREELRNVPGSQNDPIRVIENLPGLARAPFGGGQLIVRGARPNDTGAYIDGQKIPILYHLLNGPSVLSEDMVDRIDFLPGGADVYYGRSLAGIVSVTSRRGDPDRFHGSFLADLNKSQAFLQGPLGSSTQFAVGARRSYINPILKLMNDDGKQQITLPVYWDYQARVDHEIGGGDRLSLLLYGSDDGYSTVGGGGGSVQPLVNGLHIGFHRAKLTWDHKISDTLSLTVSPMVGYDLSDHNQQGGLAAFSAPQSDEERTFAWGLRSEAFYKPSERVSFRFGTDVLFDRVTYQLDQLYESQLRSIGAPNAQESLRNGVRHLGLFGEYAEAELRFGPLRFSPGLRLEQMHWNGNTFFLTEPRIWARLQASPTTTLHAYAGLYHEAPTAQELDALLGNPNLLPQKAEQYGLGATQKLSPVWSVKVEGYVNRRASLVYPATATARGDGTFDNPLQLNSGIGHSIGLEVLIRRELTARLYGWIAYTLSRSRERPAPGMDFVPTPYDQPHVLTALVGFRPSPQVEFSGRLRVASGNPDATVQGASFDGDSGVYIASRKPFGDSRLPPFVQLDFQINNIWSAEAYQVGLYLDFQNILNRKNPEYLVYDYRFTRNDAVHGIPFLASVGAKVSF